MKLKDNIVIDLDEFDESDLAYFSFKESLKARWKELKHTVTFLKKSPLFFIGFSIIVIMVGLSLFAPYIAPYKCTSTGFLGNSTCEIALDQINNKVLNALPPLTKDTRITSAPWTPVQNLVNLSTGFNESTRTFMSYIPNTSEILVGTNTGKLLLYSYTLNQFIQNSTLTLVSPKVFPLPPLPANLTTVIPATANIDNSSSGTWDIVVGGNTGEVYLSINSGTLTHPVWSPFEPLLNTVTNTPIQLNGTSSPSLLEYDRDFSPITGGGIDLIVASSGDKAIHYYMQRTFTYNDSYRQKLGWDIRFEKDNIVFQDIGNPVRHLINSNPWKLTSYNGSGIIKIQYANMDPTSRTSTDVIISFESGQTYIFLKNGPINGTTYSLFTANVSSLLFPIPPIPQTPNSDFILTDLSGRGFTDLLGFDSNGTVYFANQVPIKDGRMHWLGTDDFGGDVFSKILYAIQYDFILSVIIVGTTVFIGIVIGSISGYFGGIIDNFFMRFTDVFLAFPDLILAMAITAALGKSMINIVIALVLVDWAGTSRLIRGQVLSEKSRLYVEAAKASGLSNFRIIFKHVLPNSIYPIIVTASLGLGGVILSISGLSFLGFGPQAGAPELGRMVTDARTYFNQDPWMVFFPGLTIMIIVLAINLVGDALRDILDPKLR